MAPNNRRPAGLGRLPCGNIQPVDRNRATIRCTSDQRQSAWAFYNASAKALALAFDGVAELVLDPEDRNSVLGLPSTFRHLLWHLSIKSGYICPCGGHSDPNCTATRRHLPGCHHPHGRAGGNIRPDSRLLRWSEQPCAEELCFKHSLREPACRYSVLKWCDRFDVFHRAPNQE
ncbi:hypothetical protein OE88DRAFT_1723760 [Heliocybe sulcata]|uniref:Uncharacterized protein n=1 Tax=Heliocybe sulcata TaxID=5364 RepID=A0A5C3NAQ4_9AGAM|nr:hypothetical protein OE88DRAFT_1723760 [Heliocybe sulcata]